jgi:hypothetical protein
MLRPFFSASRQIGLERDSSELNRAGDSQKAASQIQDAGWKEASMDGQALF